MKYCLVALLVVGTFFLASCKKKDKDNESSYQLSNLHDQVMINNQSINWELPVELKSGSQEKMTVFLSDLPTNVTPLIDSISGLPPFSPVFTINAKYATPGSYIIGVNTISTLFEHKKYDVKLTILPSSDCYADIIGTYPNTKSVRNDSTFPLYHYIATIKHYSKGKVEIHCDCKEYYTVIADIDCDKGTLNIPTQFIGSPFSNTITGTGTFAENGKVVLQYTYRDSTYHFTRKYTDILN